MTQKTTDEICELFDDIVDDAEHGCNATTKEDFEKFLQSLLSSAREIQRLLEQ